jgi:hypothetical protein
MTTITAYSQPDYDSWGFDTYWSAADWRKWFDELFREFGLEEAKKRFVAAWNNPDAPSFGAIRGNYVNDDIEFIEWAKDMGIYRSISTGLVGVINDATYTVLKTGERTTDVINNTTEGVLNTSNSFKYLIPALFIVLLFVAYGYIKQVIKP